MSDEFKTSELNALKKHMATFIQERQGIIGDYVDHLGRVGSSQSQQIKEEEKMQWLHYVEREVLEYIDGLSPKI